MSKYLILGIVSGIAPVPAVAQPVAAAEEARLGPGEQIDRIAQMVDRDRQRGLISQADAAWFRAEMASLRKMHQRYRNFEPRTREHSELMRRIDALRAQLLAAERQRFTRQAPPPRLSPVERGSPFEDARPPSLVDPSSSLEEAKRRSDRSYETGLYRDDVHDMNAMRGPAPEKHEEGN